MADTILNVTTPVISKKKNKKTPVDQFGYYKRQSEKKAVDSRKNKLKK